MPRGGRRPGAGKPKGYKHQTTLEKQRVLAACRQLVLQKAERMFGAQIEHACGVRSLVLQREDGTYARATDQKQVDGWIAAGGTLGELFIHAPNTQAFTALMDRTFGKPTENLEISGPDGGPVIYKWEDD
jgi:hypothetical protein